MSTQEHPSSQEIRLQAVEEGSPLGDLVAVFGFASQKPAVGQPGPQPGDLLVQQRGETGYTVSVSLGKPEACSPETVRQAGGALGKWLTKSGAGQIDLDLDSLQTALAGQAGYRFMDAAAALCEGIKLGAYRFNRYKTTGEAASSIPVRLSGGENPAQNHVLAERVEAVAGAVLMARDLSHEPANIINPVTLGERAAELARQYPALKVRILDGAELFNMGAGAISAVGRGSQTPPQIIILEYLGEGNSGELADSRPVALVGKAITFDTGGYSLKNTDGIVGMKYDKCGGVAVLAIMQAAANMKIKTPLVGIIGAAENMISNEAYRPDDIITSLNGKTIEIISTDAEGRLALADALAYAQRQYKPRALIDLATLTGGVVVALGKVRAGLLTNDDDLANQLFAAGEKTFERLWRLPLDDDYTQMIRGDDADLKNSGGREGHCILGGAFLKEFVEPGVPWAHLDIAGVAATSKDLPYAPKGATGFGIRLLVEYLRGLEEA